MKRRDFTNAANLVRLQAARAAIADVVCLEGTGIQPFELRAVKAQIDVLIECLETTCSTPPSR